MMGLGRFERGSGISAARFFAKRGARVTVTDLKSSEELASSIKLLRGLPITYVMGEHRAKDFTEADIVIRNPDVRSNNPFLSLARKHGARVTTDVSIFFELCPKIISIGITGTRGKSTITALIGAIMNAAGIKAYVGGNIQNSPLNFLDDLISDYAHGRPVTSVIELSSWLLEGMSHESAAPGVAVVTNIYRDHLNTYPSMKEYVAAKKEIFRHRQSTVILNYDNAATHEMAKEVKGRVLWFSLKPFEGSGVFVRGKNIIFRFGNLEEKIAETSDIRHLLGSHNLANALSAIAVCKLYDVSNSAIVRTLRTFSGLPNRLELIRTFRGVRYYNDTTATTPDGVMAALNALAPKSKRIILIAGGKDKELEFNKFAAAIKKHVHGLVLFDGTATNKLLLELKRTGFSCAGVPVVKSMESAVERARQMAKQGDVILLSPGAASFGLFKNEFDRGAQFVKMCLPSKH